MGLIKYAISSNTHNTKTQPITQRLTKGERGYEEMAMFLWLSPMGQTQVPQVVSTL